MKGLPGTACYRGAVTVARGSSQFPCAQTADEFTAAANLQFALHLMPEGRAAEPVNGFQCGGAAVPGGSVVVIQVCLMTETPVLCKGRCNKDPDHVQGHVYQRPIHA